MIQSLLPLLLLLGKSPPHLVTALRMVPRRPPEAMLGKRVPRVDFVGLIVEFDVGQPSGPAVVRKRNVGVAALPEGAVLEAVLLAVVVVGVGGGSVAKADVYGGLRVGKFVFSLASFLRVVRVG